MRAFFGLLIICGLAFALIRQSADTPIANNASNAQPPVQAPKKVAVPQKPATPQPPPLQNKPASAFSGDVSINIETEELGSRHIRIRGSTNLPAGTELMLSVDEVSKNGFHGGTKAVVSADGTFQGGPFGPAGGLAAGRYEAEVVMPFAFTQPPHIQQIIGAKGERLTGSLVKREEFGAMASATKPFVIGGADAVATQDARTKDRIRQYKEWLTYATTLYSRMEQAHSLNLLANENNLANLAKWGEFARAYRAEYQTKHEQLMTLEPPYPRLLIAAALGDVDNMFSAIAFRKGERDYQAARSEYAKDLTELRKFIKEQESAQ